MKLVQENNPEIVSHFLMKDGDFAIVMAVKGNYARYLDSLFGIVYRSGKQLIFLGESYGRSHSTMWSHMEDIEHDDVNCYMVRILPKGTKLEI